MAGNYAQKAVAALYDRHVAQLPTELAAVETEQSLAAGALAEPEAYLDHRAIYDNRSPLIQVYDEGVAEGDDRAGVWIVPCTVVLSYLGGTNLSANELFVRRYLTALMRVVQKDPTLGSTSITLVDFVNVDAARVEGDRAASRHLYGIGWNVHIYERECC